jgi:branched-chain amino acid transport system permease protein
MITNGVAGLAAGGTYALLGVCVVLLYRVVAVVSFAGAALAAFGAFTTTVLTEHGWAFAPALIVGVACGAAVTALAGLVMATWFAESSPSTKAAVMVAFLVGLISLGARIFGAEHPHDFPSPFSGGVVTIAGAVITEASVITVVLAAALTVGISAFLKRTRTGVRLRALSERPSTAEHLGLRTRWLACGMWATSGALATIAIVVIAPSRTPSFSSLSLLIVPALAAALIGLFQSIEIAFFGGLALGILEGVAAGIDQIQEYRGVLPFAVILVALLWSQRKEQWDEAR